MKSLFPSNSSTYSLTEEIADSSPSLMECRFSEANIHKRLVFIEYDRYKLPSATVNIYFDYNDKIVGVVFDSSSYPYLFREEDCTGYRRYMKKQGKK